jgi:hypothetical protein
MVALAMRGQCLNMSEFNIIFSMRNILIDSATNIVTS